MTHTIELPPRLEELATQAARAHGQSVDDHLAMLVMRALLSQEPPVSLPEGTDSLSLWEQEMDVRRGGTAGAG